MALILAKQVLRKQLPKFFPLVTNKRTTTFDYVRTMIGKREIVGFGWNGQPSYYDRPDYPFPAIRFREATPEICKLREKEQGDWKELTIDEVKSLYRYSFCQTFAEYHVIDPYWKVYLAHGIYSIGIGLLMSYIYYLFLYGDYPETFKEDRRQAQLKRIIALEMNPVQGLTSKWDYDKNRWKGC